MALTDAERLDLYERLRRTSLGEEGANVVMNALPNVDWNRLATGQDVDMSSTVLRSELAAVRSELLGEIAAVRSELLGEIAAVRSELLGEIAVVRSELRDEIAAVRSELGSEIAALRSELHDEIGAVRVDMREMELRLQRTLITWIMAAQGVTLAVLSVLTTLLVVTLD